jgi:UDPglucose 6-dehydrogenase
MRLAVLGTGYVGLVSAACLAELGHEVTAVDIDAERIAALQRGEMPIHEPGLEALLKVHRATARLGFTVDLRQALQAADVVMIAIGTPPGPGGEADLRAVLQAAHAVGQQLQHPATLVLKSTVPPGTAEQVAVAVNAPLERRGRAFTVPVVGNPEFLREGSAVQDFLQPDRIVIGADTRGDAELMHVMYAPLLERGVPMLVMDTRSAELTKYAANVMLAARISLVNELADIAEALGADIEQVRQGIGSDARVGPQFLRAGLGYGGSCFPKDVQALAQMASMCGRPALMLEAVHRVNERQRRRPFALLARHYGSVAALQGRRIAVWGLAFKPGTDDLREAPGILLVEQLLAAGAEVQACDPVAASKAQVLLGRREGLRICRLPLAALRGADALVLVTEWPQFRRVDAARAAALLRDRLVIDGRNALDAARWTAAGVQLMQVGRPAATGTSRSAAQSAPSSAARARAAATRRA